MYASLIILDYAITETKLRSIKTHLKKGQGQYPARVGSSTLNLDLLEE